MYTNSTVCTKTNYGLSNFIQINKGVHQGNNLSPTLFNIYINDIVDVMKENDSPHINQIENIPCLMYADDIALLSTTKVGLQNKLNKLSTYCKQWALDINVEKTKVVIFAKHDPIISNRFTYDNDVLEIVDSYKYLGIFFHKSGKMDLAQDHLAKQGNKACYSLKRTLYSENLRTDVATKLFDSLITPILLYGSEIWFPFVAGKSEEASFISFFDDCLSTKFPHEKVHLQYCRSILGVHKKSMKLPVLAELGRFPISFIAIYQVISFWLHVINSNEQSYVHQIYTNLCNEKKSNKWICFVKEMLKDLGLQHVWINQGTFNVKRLKYAAQNILESKYISFWKQKKKESNRLKFYDSITINSTYKMETYLLLPISRLNKSSLCKLRISAHDLLIERGRYNNTPREERKCNVCQVLEDEIHFLDFCIKHIDLRTKFFNKTLPSNCIKKNLEIASLAKYVSACF
jgi:hypothetical protein